MDEALAPHLRWTQKDRLPVTPAISLELRGPEKLWRKTTYLFEVTLRRVDGKDSPCLFQWTPHIHGFVASGFILLHHAPEGLKQIEFPRSTLPALGPWVTEESCYIEHITGRVHRWMDVLPVRFFTYLTAGERYTLFWPGERYAAWEWGVAKNGLIPTQDTSLVLPGGPMLTFTVEEGEQPLHAPNMWPVEILSRAGKKAPILTASITCASTVPLEEGGVETLIYIYYHPGPSGETRSIIFNISLPICPTIYRWCGRWKACTPEIWDDLAFELSLGDHDAFPTLHPGEVWTSFVKHPLPYGARVGDSLRAQLRETKIDWWEWKSLEGHLSTKRPSIVIPASEPVDIQIT